MRNSKSTPKVKNGKVQKKNNHKLTPNYWSTQQSEIQIDEEKPGKGYKHFLKKRDVINFLSLIPNWDELSTSLNAIILEQGNPDYFGVYYESGVIGISAWEKDKDLILDKSIYLEIRGVLKKLGVKSIEKSNGYFCEFSTDQIKAFQLLYILLHELGHHYDRLKTKTKNHSARGEQYAEDFAYINGNEIWKKYQNKFNVVF